MESARLERTEALPSTNQAFSPPPRDLLVWRAPARTTLDDTGLLDRLQQAALLQRLDAGRGVGPREVAGVVEELRAIHDESRNARINKTYVLPYIALVPTAASTITDVMLAMRDLREADRNSRFAVAMRGDGGLVDLPVELLGPGWIQPETCAHDRGSERPCSIPELEVTRRGWCVRPAKGWVDSPCLVDPPIHDLDGALIRSGLVRPLPGSRPVDAGPPPIIPRCEPVAPDQLMTKVAQLVSAQPGCVRSRVTAVGNVSWGEVAPVLADLAGQGLLPGLKWKSPDDDTP